MDRPHVDEGEFKEVLVEARRVLSEEPSVIYLPTHPLAVAGDTHGDFESTEEVFARFPEHIKVFLGDYVDRRPRRGSSTYNLFIILKKKIEKPKEVVLLRGNHEFENLWRYGFRDSLGDRQLRGLTGMIAETMAELPYVAISENNVIMLHAGIPDVQSRDELEVPKGLHNYNDNKIACQMVWNDSMVNGDTLGPLGWISNINRGFRDDYAILYDEHFLEEKLKLLDGSVLLRGHDYNAKGHTMNDKVLTIFTARQYADVGDMKGSYVALVDPWKTIETTRDLEIVPIGEYALTPG